jgi:hypothetical protein
MAEKCGGYGKREGNCGELLGVGNTSGLCKKCYANKSYHERHPKAAVRVVRAPKEIVAKENGHALTLTTSIASAAPVAEPPVKNKLRFVLFEADVDSGNLSQLTDAISQALGVKAAR